MDLITIITMLVSLGLGGIVGALASAILSSARLKTTFESFKPAFRTYFAGKTDASSLEVITEFEVLSAEVDRATTAFARLKRALRWKSRR
ncbi:MAG: hypothetical protein IH851_05440 [Armatimonadetes bacterium]|nr:hypothetical protein [Armatimonadota bacterium]